MSRIDQNDKVVIMPYSYVFNQESFYKQVIDIHLLLQTFFQKNGGSFVEQNSKEENL